jgi:hypothetical protein
MNESDTGVRHEAQRGRRKRYEYFERLTFVHLVRGIPGNIGRVKGKGNEAPNTVEGNESERN